MQLCMRLATAAITAVLLSGGSCSQGSSFTAETPPVAAAPANPAPAATPAPAADPAPSNPPPDQSSSPAPGPAPSQPVTFTSFSAIQPSQTVVMPTVSNAARVTAQQQGADERVTGFTMESLNWHSSGAQLTYDANGALSGIRVEASPTDTLNFQRSAGDTVSCSGGGCQGSNGTQNIVFVNPAALGWSYQTFGVWGSEALAPSGRLGAVSMGAVTPGNAIPTTGTHTFAGRALGFYSDAAGTPYATGATLSALVNFASRNITFTTSGTTISNNGNATAMPGLNLSGNLTYAPGTNISGQVQTQNGALTGNADGRFYGPGAEEIGGVYSLSGSGTSRMIGGFGGRR